MVGRAPSVLVRVAAVCLGRSDVGSRGPVMCVGCSQVSLRGAISGGPFPVHGLVHGCFAVGDVIVGDRFAGRQPVTPLAGRRGALARGLPTAARSGIGIVRLAHPPSVRPPWAQGVPRRPAGDPGWVMLSRHDGQT